MNRLVGVVLAMLSAAVMAAPPLIPFQGKITQAGAGIQLNFGVNFRLYATATGGTPLYEESRSVNFDSGSFSVYIGEVTPLSEALFADHAELYLGVQLDADSQEMSPRFRLPTASFATHATVCSAVSWTGVANVPPRLTNLSELSCATGHAIVSTDGGWTCAPTGYTKPEADERFTRLKQCYWTSRPGDGGTLATVTCAPGDHVVSGGCDGNAIGSPVMESFPGPSSDNYKGNMDPVPFGADANDPVNPVFDQWRCRTTSGSIDSAYAFCCPAR